MTPMASIVSYITSLTQIHFLDKNILKLQLTGICMAQKWGLDFPTACGSTGYEQPLWTESG